jgi:hypothetical protein
MVPSATTKAARHCALLLVAAHFPALASAQDSEPVSFASAMTSGKAHLAFRYRYEHVDQDNFAEDANASTLRFRLNYATDTWRGWSAFGEFDYVGELLFDDFNSGAGTSPDRTQYPVVADPEGAYLNQLFLGYRAGKDTRLTLGRQTIILDNQRFVGSVGWRQHEQTFDAFNVGYEGFARTEVSYSFVTQVNRVFGERSPMGKDNESTQLLNAKIRLNDRWSLSPYVYYIDSDDTPAFSTATFGARVLGKIAVANGNVSLAAEFASQSDTADAPVDFSADYFLLDANWEMKNGLSLGLAMESLGGNQVASGQSFRTPLATLHAFQGWADQFLTTPDAGVIDVYGTVQYKVAKWSLQATWHDFAAESGDAKWGTELDLSAGRRIGERYGVVLIGALFNADDAPFVDVNKYWIMLTAGF